MTSSSPLRPTPEQIEDLQLATTKMQGDKRRSFIAEISLKYCDGGARKTETMFGWGRDMASMGYCLLMLYCSIILPDTRIG